MPKGHRRIGFASGGDSSRRRSGCRLVTIRVAIDGWRLSCQSRGLGNATPGTSESLRTGQVPIALCRSGTTAFAARGRDDTLTALPAIAMPAGGESQMMQGNWLETKSRPAGRSVCLRARMPASS